VQGNWQCAQCQRAITELPFTPREGQEVLCKDCYLQNRGGSNSRPQRPKYQGNWQCAGCGAEITELPFQPSPGKDVFCRNCYKSNR